MDGSGCEEKWSAGAGRKTEPDRSGAGRRRGSSAGQGAEQGGSGAGRVRVSFAWTGLACTWAPDQLGFCIGSVLPIFFSISFYFLFVLIKLNHFN